MRRMAIRLNKNRITPNGIMRYKTPKAGGFGPLRGWEPPFFGVYYICCSLAWKW